MIWLTPDDVLLPGAPWSSPSWRAACISGQPGACTTARRSHFAVHMEAAITHKRPKVRRPAVKSAARGVGVKVMPWIPPWLKRLLAGGRRITIDGNTLDPTLQLILAAIRRSTPTGSPSIADDLRL